MSPNTLAEYEKARKVTEAEWDGPVYDPTGHGPFDGSGS